MGVFLALTWFSCRAKLTAVFVRQFQELPWDLVFWARMNWESGVLDRLIWYVFLLSYKKVGCCESSPEVVGVESFWWARLCVASTLALLAMSILLEMRE